MSTVKVNEIRHLSNSGTANLVLESNATTNLQATSTLGLTVTGTLTVSGVSTFNGNTVVGNASSDTMVLTSTVSGFNNFSGFTGEIRMYAGNAAGDAPPAGWLYCNGDTISSTSGNGGTHYNLDGKGNDYQPLFNLLKASNDWANSSSATWGTNTVKTPDFRSRAPVGNHTGAATSITAGLTSRTLSDTAGTETYSLTIAELAVHTHVTTATGPSVSGQTVTATIVDHTHSYAHTHGTPSRSTTAQTTSTTTANNRGHTHTFPIGGYTSPTANNAGVGYSGHEWGTVTTAGESQNHTHTYPHQHTVPGTTTNSQNTSTTGNQSAKTITASLGSETHTHTIAQVNAEHAGTSAAGTAHTILQPIIAVNYIIKV
jgi:microcystin-dependent protein